MRHPTPSQLAYMQTHVSDDRRSWLIGVNALCLLLAAIAVSLRLASRIKIGTKIGLDDGLVCGALVALFGHALCLFITIRFGLGRHTPLSSNLRAFFVTSLTGQTLYNLCIPMIKLSILTLYHRIFAGENMTTSAWFTPTLWVTALFIFMATIPQCFVHVFQCVPIDSLWNDYMDGYRVVCIDFQAAIVAFGVINIVTNWFILALPIPIALSFSLTRRAKWSVCSLFLVGSLVCIASIVRLFFAKRFESADPTWDYSVISTMSTTECALGILAVCMPTWRPLLKFSSATASSYFGSAASKPNVLYGKKKALGKGGLLSRKKAGSGDLRSKIDHKGMGTGMLGKRSETSMSGSSMEKMLSLGTANASPRNKNEEMEMQSPRGSPAWTRSGTASPTSPMPLIAMAPATLLSTESENRGASRSGTQGLVDPDAQAKADEERWRKVIEAQQRKNEEEMEKFRSASRAGSRAGSRPVSPRTD